MKTFRFDTHIFEYDDNVVFTVDDALKLLEAEANLQEKRVKRDKIKSQNLNSICNTVKKAVSEITDTIDNWDRSYDPVSGVEHIDFYENQDDGQK